MQTAWEDKLRKNSWAVVVETALQAQFLQQNVQN